MGLSDKRQEILTLSNADTMFDAHQRECEEILDSPAPLGKDEAQLRAYAIKRLRHIKLLRTRMPINVFKS
jgi:hypothetical protein